MTCQHISSFSSEILTVVGWLATFGIAIWQINKAHEKNRKLNKELMLLSVHAEQYKQFLALYSDIIKAIIGLKIAVGHVQVNLMVEQTPVMLDKGVKFGWRDNLQDINDTYSVLSEKVTVLNIWMSAADKGLPNSSDIYATIEKFINKFTITNSEEMSNHPWVTMQGMLMGIQSGKEPTPDQFTSACAPAMKALDEIKTELENHAKAVQQRLFENLN